MENRLEWIKLSSDGEDENHLSSILIEDYVTIRKQRLSMDTSLGTEMELLDAQASFDNSIIENSGGHDHIDIQSVMTNSIKLPDGDFNTRTKSEDSSHLSNSPTLSYYIDDIFRPTDFEKLLELLDDGKLSLDTFKATYGIETCTCPTPMQEHFGVEDLSSASSPYTEKSHGSKGVSSNSMPINMLSHDNVIEVYLAPFIYENETVAYLCEIVKDHIPTNININISSHLLYRICITTVIAVSLVLSCSIVTTYKTFHTTDSTLRTRSSVSSSMMSSNNNNLPYMMQDIAASVGSVTATPTTITEIPDTCLNASSMKRHHRNLLGQLTKSLYKKKQSWYSILSKTCPGYLTWTKLVHSEDDTFHSTSDTSAPSSSSHTKYCNDYVNEESFNGTTEFCTISQQKTRPFYDFASSIYHKCKRIMKTSSLHSTSDTHHTTYSDAYTTTSSSSTTQNSTSDDSEKEQSVLMNSADIISQTFTALSHMKAHRKLLKQLHTWKQSLLDNMHRSNPHMSSDNKDISLTMTTTTTTVNTHHNPVQYFFTKLLKALKLDVLFHQITPPAVVTLWTMVSTAVSTQLTILTKIAFPSLLKDIDATWTHMTAVYEEYKTIVMKTLFQSVIADTIDKSVLSMVQTLTEWGGKMEDVTQQVFETVETLIEHITVLTQDITMQLLSSHFTTPTLPSSSSSSTSTCMCSGGATTGHSNGNTTPDMAQSIHTTVDVLSSPLQLLGGSDKSIPQNAAPVHSTLLNTHSTMMTSPF